jgi:Mn2+/Fe2+ NRAMP family transporter
MPWMVFYQQEAVIDKGHRTSHIRTALRAARLDTALAAIVTQVVMIAIVVAVAATIGTTHPGASLNSIGDIAAALTPFLGHHNAVLFFGLGMLGAATVAALVVCLADAWGVAEVLGWKHSLNDSPRRAAGFYSLAVSATLAGALLVMVTPNLVDVEVLNACLLPVVLGFLLILERRTLPAAFRMHGIRRLTTYTLTGVVITLGLYTGFQALTGHL